ncbi:MAG: hypothetical protein HC819_08230 [Cyclobacteriaceae bacterium]|nr:hypothetical protein [Cyclobacteriaceae bacterium]
MHTLNYYFIITTLLIIPMKTISQNINESTLLITPCEDFELNGNGDQGHWDEIPWTTLQSANNAAYKTQIKMMYSATGVYVLGHCEDRLISTRYRTDQGDIWNGDVFEIFLQTGINQPLYFEYEINPLGAELAILVPNDQGTFFGWSPWHYEGDRKIRKAVKIHGGTPDPGEKIKAWSVEIFIPYKLLTALQNVPPKPGTEWRGNFYRMDYDSGERETWAWQAIEKTFHEYEKFGRLIFE